MSSYPKALKWNATQVKILEMLKTKASHHQISKDLHVNISTVVKVHNSVKKGQSPATPYVPKQKKAKAGTAEKVAVNTYQIVETTSATQQAFEVKNNADAVTQATNTSSTNTQQQTPAPITSPVSEPTLARLVPTPVIVQLTPLMYSAKAYLVERRGWSENVKWEDIIDTIFGLYFRSIGVILRGWYEEDEVKPAKRVPEEDKGEGHKKQAEPNALKQLADMVTLQIIQLAHQG